MKNIKTLLTISAFVLASASAFAANGGVTALPFLKMDMGAKYYGMAGAATGFADDITGSTFYNPAALGQVESFQLAGTTFEGTMDMNYNYGGVALPINFLSFFGNNPLNVGASVYVFDKGDITDSYGTRSAGSDNSFALTLGEHIGTNTWEFMGSSSDVEHYIGLSGKYITSSLPRPGTGKVTANVFAFDAGYQAVVDRHFGLGVALRNAGSKVKYIQQEDPLPYTLSAGIFYTPVELDYVKWTLTADYLDYIKEKESRVRLGTEAVFMDILSVRGGVKLLEEIKEEYTLGFGIKLLGFEVDFGTVLNPQLNDDKVYQATLAYKFPVKKVDTEEKKDTKKYQKIADYDSYKQKETKKAEVKAEQNANPILYE